MLSRHTDVQAAVSQYLEASFGGSGTQGHERLYARLLPVLLEAAIRSWWTSANMSMRRCRLMDEMPDLAGASSGTFLRRARAGTKGAMPPRRLGTYQSRRRVDPICRALPRMAVAVYGVCLMGQGRALACRTTTLKSGSEAWARRFVIVEVLIAKERCLSCASAIDPEAVPGALAEYLLRFPAASRGGLDSRHCTRIVGAASDARGVEGNIPCRRGWRYNLRLLPHFRVHRSVHGAD